MSEYTGSPNTAAIFCGSRVGSCADLVWAGAVETRAFFAATSQPRTSTCLTWSAEVTTERKRSRSVPPFNTSGFASVWPPAAGASDAGVGLPKVNAPSRTAISYPTWRARCSRNSQSLVPPWERWSWTVLVDCTSPILRPARLATLVATSEAVTWV